MSLVDTRLVKPFLSFIDAVSFASIWRSFAFFDLITHFNSRFYILFKNVAEIACKSVLTWVLFLICRLEFPLIDFSLRNTIARISS